MLLTLENIKHSQGSKRIINIDNLTIEKDKHFLILFDKEKGKTCLSKILAGLHKPDSGKVKMNKCDLYLLFKKNREDFIQQKIGIIPQNPLFIENITLRENINILRNISKSSLAMSQINDIIDILDFNQSLNRYILDLPYCLLQKLSIFKAFANSPELIIADDLTSKLKQSETDEILKKLLKIAQLYNSTIILITDDKRAEKYFKYSIHHN